MLTDENPPVIERALLILGKTIERKQVMVQKIEVTKTFLQILINPNTYILVDISVLPVIM